MSVVRTFFNLRHVKVALVLLLVSFNQVSAQTSEKISADSTTVHTSSNAWMLNGFISVNQSVDGTYFTMGGPGISLSKGQNELSLRLLPSFRINNNVPFLRHSLSVLPVMGVALQWRRSNLIINLPAAYYALGSWETAFGIGYVIKSREDRKRTHPSKITNHEHEE